MGEYDDEDGGHESLGYDYDARRRSYGYASASPEVARRPTSRSSRLPPSGRRSRGNREGCYDDGYRTASNPRFEGNPQRRSSRASFVGETPQRSRSRASAYDSLPPRHPSRASNFDSLPRQPSRQSDFPHGRKQENSPQRKKFERRSSLGDSIAEGISVGYKTPLLSRQPSKGSAQMMYDREIPEEESKEEEVEEVPEVEEPEHFEFEEEKVPEKEYEFDDDDSFDAEQEIKMMLKQGKSIDRVLPEPFMKSFYVYKTRGPDKLEMFERDDEILDFDKEATYRPPTCDIKLRSHTVWEKMYVKFTCTVKGKPLPKITWYKNMIPIQPLNDDAGHIKMTSQYGVHTLEIFRTSLEDSGTYRISAQNCKGEVSSFATLVVKRYIPGRKSLYPSKSFDDAKFYGATNFNDEDETKTIREHNFGYDVTKPKLERQSSAVIEYKQQKSVEELAEEGAKYVESDEYKQAQKKMKDKKDKESKKKKNKVSFEDEKSGKTETKDKTSKQNENQGQNYKVFDGKSEKKDSVNAKSKSKSKSDEHKLEANVKSGGQTVVNGEISKDEKSDEKTKHKDESKSSKQDKTEASANNEKVKRQNSKEKKESKDKDSKNKSVESNKDNKGENVKDQKKQDQQKTENKNEKTSEKNKKDSKD